MNSTGARQDTTQDGATDEFRRWAGPFGVRWEAKRHTALDGPVVPVRCTPEESKAVSALRSATALHGGRSGTFFSYTRVINGHLHSTAGSLRSCPR